MARFRADVLDIVQAGAVVAGAVPKVPIKASSGLQVTHVAPLNVAEHVA